MSRKYKFRNPEGLYFVSFAVVNWIDVFTRRIYKDILLDGLQYCIDNKGLKVHAYVLMTNHAHLIISKTDPGKALPFLLGDLKKFTALKLIHVIKDNAEESRKEWLIRGFRKAGSANPNNKEFQFWQQDNHPIELTSSAMTEQKVVYIHQNPVEAGIVFRAEDYLYSSAADYVGEKGLLKIDMLW
ncbi:MAG: transposase [Chitinophagaceae bacterium]|nr:transposase [Chitinophagaceae bacterium]